MCWNHIKLTQADIIKATQEAIVNAANPKMLGGGGVDGAIHKAAGPRLLAACKKVKAINGIRCPFGEARITESGDLHAKYVIHTCGPIYRNEDNPQKILQAAYKNSLQLALEHNCSSIAFPAISCGAYGYPLKEAAYIALSECSQKRYRSLRIVFYLLGDNVLHAWQSEYNALSTAS